MVESIFSALPHIKTLYKWHQWNNSFCLQCTSGEWQGGAGADTSGSFASRSRGCGCKGVEAATMFPEPTMDRSATVEEAAHSCHPSHLRNTQEHKLVWWAGRVTFPQGTPLGAGSHLGLWWSRCWRLRERTLVAGSQGAVPWWHLSSL